MKREFPKAGIQRCDVRQPQADGRLGGAEGWYSMLTPLVREAVRAAQDRKAVDLDLLDLKGVGSFTDFFLICSGTSSRHTQAIYMAWVWRDEVPLQIRKKSVKEPTPFRSRRSKSTALRSWAARTASRTSGVNIEYQPS